MSGNTTSLYSTSSSNGTTGSNNFTTLYPSQQGVIVPTTPYGNANVVALLNAGTDGSNTVANITATGNIQGNVFIGNGAGLTNIPGGNIVGGYGNSNVVSLLANFGSNTVSTTGNVTASNVIANNVSTPTVYNQGMAVQGYDFVQMQYSNSVTLPVSPYDIGTGSFFYLDAGGATFQSNTTGTLKQVIIGNDSSISATGNITGGNIFTAGAISATGNISANPSSFFIGNGSQLTGIIAASPAPSIVNGNSSVVVNANGNVTTSVTGVSNVIVVAPTGEYVTGVVSATGNITGNYILGNGAFLTGIAATYGNANVTNLLANLGSNIISGTGNITTTANISGNYILGNGSQLTGLPATYGNANVVSLLANFGSNSISTTGNVDSGNINTTSIYAGGVVSATGNVRGGNINTNGLITATGNITGAYFIGNGSQLTGLPSGYSNADVATFLANFGSNTISTTGNITGGLFTGNGAGLTSLTGANVTGTVANATYALNSNSASYANHANVSDVANAVSGSNVSGQVANALVAGTVYTAAQPNITSVGTLTSIATSGDITATGNITSTSGVFTGNGAGLTNINAGNIVGAYGNANVVNLLANFGSNTISTTGNVTTGNLTVQSDAVITGNLTVNGNTTTVHSNVVTIDDKFINVANNASTAAQANGGGLGVGPQGSEYATLTYNSTANAWNTNIAISATGNVSGTYITGNGSALSSITGANVTGTVANATYATSAGSANTANTAVTVTGNAQANITSVGVLTSLSVSGNTTSGNVLTSVVQATSSAGLSLKNSGGTTQASLGAGGGDNFAINVSTNLNGNNAQIDISPTGTGHVHIKPTGTGAVEIAPTNTGSINNMIIGNVTPAAVSATTVSASGNVTGNYFIGNGSQLTGLPTSYSNANVATFLANFGSNSISTTGNVTASNFFGNGSGLTSITGANVTGTVANATYAVNANAATFAGTVTTNAQPNITSVGTLTSLSVTGNITGNYFIGNGSQLTGIVASSNAAGSNTQIQYNNANAFAGSANLTFDNTTNTLTTTTVTATANITAANVFSYYTSNGTIVNSTVASNVNATVNPNRIVYGTGYRGDYGANADPINFNRNSQLAVIGTQIIANSDAISSARLFTSSYFLDLNQGANITNTNKRLAAGGFFTQIGNGNITLTPTSGVSLAAILNGGSQTLVVGNQANVTMGNAIVSHAAALNSTILAATGGTIGNALGSMVTIQSQVANSTFSTSQIGYGVQFQGTSGTVSGNVIGYYMPSNVATAYGWTSTNLNRAATNYYFLKNDDAVAQTQLGSLRSYNEFRYDTATTGNITLDKNNAQVQYIAPTANVTIDGYANMVTSLSDSVNTDQEIDTLTILVQQGATPYTVTLPTGSTYQYAGNISTVPAVANSRSILTVVAANIAGTVNYFTTVSSDQAATVSAGGSNTQIQYNNAGVLAGNSQLTFDNTTGNIVIGNITVGYGNGVVSTGNLAARLNNPTQWNGGYANSTSFQAGQTILGSGYYGNLTQTQSSFAGIRGSKWAIWESANVTDGANAGVRLNAFAAQQQVILNGNLTSTNTFFRAQALGLAIGGGSAGNTLNSGGSNAGGQGLGSAAGASGFLTIGQAPGSTVALGNTTIAGGSGFISQLFLQNGSQVSNAALIFGQYQSQGNIPNAAGIALQFSTSNSVQATTSSSVYGIYMPGVGNSATMSGISNSNNFRRAPNYYFLFNEDSVAQNQLGSLRAYHTFQAGGNTTGTWDIDKTNGQVQAISATGNITIGSYTNFVTTANDGTNNDSQTDTVTLIIEQGSTPYTVTMPTGNSAIRYANGVSTVTSTANTTTMIAITAYRTSANATGYLTTISPAFS